MTPAEKKLKSAVVDMLCLEPFFGTLVLSLPFKEDVTCDTAWTDGRNIGYNPAFIDSISFAETQGLIRHEVLHVAMGHPWRKDAREHRRFNVACFAEGTPVLMADGTQKAIDQIGIGESVWSPYGPSRVLGVKYSGVEPCVRVSYNDSSFLCTGNHPILTTKGLIHADATQGYRGLYCRAERQSRSASVYSGKLSNDGAQGFVSQYKSEVHGNFDVSTEARVSGESLYDQTLQRPLSAQSLLRGLRILGGNRGWRGNYFGADFAEGLHSSTRSNFQHGIFAAAMAQGARILRNFDQKHETEGILSRFMEWMATGQIVALDPSLSGYQGGLGGFSLGAYLNSRDSAVQRASDGAYAADCLRDSDYQQTRLEVSGLSESCWPVYDIITEKQFIVAAGLVVHNCDLAINPDCGTLPKGALVPDASQLGKSAEWIYARLPESPKDKGGSGGNGTPQSGKGKPDPAGEVRDAPTGQDEDGHPAPTEGEWKQKTAEALQAAKMAGSLPSGLARMVEAALDKRIDVRSLLLRFMVERTRADFNWNMPSRRYAHLGLYLPALESIAMGEVAIMIDTSGSVDAASLSYARAIVEDVISECSPIRVSVWYSDAKVCHVSRFEQGEPLVWEPKGGGGTDFRPVLKAIEDEGTAVAVLCITDLYGALPDTAPSMPTLWLCTTDQVCPFGETIPLPQ